MRRPRKREPSIAAVAVEVLAMAELLRIVNAAPTDPLYQSALERDAWREIATRGGVRSRDRVDESARVEIRT